MSNITRLSRSTIPTTILYIGLILSLPVLSSIVIVVLGPQWIIGGMLLAFAVVLSWVKPALYMQGLLVVSLALPAGFTTTQIFSIQVGEYNVLYTDVLFGIIVLRWILGQAGSRKRSQMGNVVARRLSFLIILLLLYAAFSLFRGLLEYNQFALSMYDARPIFYYILILVAFDFVKTEQNMEGLSKGILIGLFLYSALVLSYFLAPSGHPLAAAQEVNSWAYANRIGFSNGAYLILAMPMVSLLLIDRRIARYAKFLLLFALPALIAVLVLSMSRTSVVALALSLILVYSLYNRSLHDRNRIGSTVTNSIFIVFLILIGALIAIEQVLPLLLGEASQYTLETFIRRFDLGSSMAYQSHVVPRIVMLRTALSLILKNPFFGYGFGYQFDLLGWSSLVTFVDNSYLTIWIRLGMIGFAVLAGLIFLAFQSIRQSLRPNHLPGSPYAHIFIVSLAVSGIPILIVSLNTSWLVTSSAVIPLLIITGAMMGFSAQCANATISRQG